MALTFDYWRDTDEHVDPKACGEDFFAKRDIGQVHVFAHWNHWFEVEEMARVIQTIAEASASAETRIVYGSSMGGFAALAFAASLSADIAIAFAPQFSIDPARQEHDRRFLKDALAIQRYAESRDSPEGAFRYELLDQVRLPARTYVGFDPDHPPDVAHVDSISQHNEVIPILCRGSGHWPDVALRKSGLLSSVIEGVIEGTLALPANFELSDPRTMA